MVAGRLEGKIVREGWKEKWRRQVAEGRQPGGGSWEVVAGRFWMVLVGSGRWFGGFWMVAGRF